jgi:hypothetical protein
MEQMPNPMYRKEYMANPNIYDNKYGQPGYVWNNWPDICGMRIWLSPSFYMVVQPMKSKQVPSRMKVKAIGDPPRGELTSRL